MILFEQRFYSNRKGPVRIERVLFKHKRSCSNRTGPAPKNTPRKHNGLPRTPQNYPKPPPLPHKYYNKSN
ncbi:hypothetical protein GIB67_009593, partial [Kingdonia uniflora]